MSGIVSGMNYSILFGGAGSSDPAASMLNILYGGGSSPTPTTFISSGNPITDLKLAEQQEATAGTKEARQPQVANTITAFIKAVKGAKTIQSALLNPTIQQVLLTANGLSSYIGDTGMVQKLFLSDPSVPTSTVSRFANATWTSAVQSFNFAKNGLAALTNPKVISTLTNGYAEVMWRQSLDQVTPGLSNALTFIGQASQIKSVGDILDNYANFEVITTALGIPQSIINQSTAAQTAAIKSRLDVSKLQDPKFVTSLTDQYLLVQNEGSTSNTGGLIV